MGTVVKLMSDPSQLILAASGLWAMLVLSPAAYSQDAVFSFKPDGGVTKANGSITGMDPEGVTIDNNKIPSAEIKRISIGKEPAGISRARDQMDAGRYSDCLEELDKIKPLPTEPLLVQEISFMQAYCGSQLSLQGGAITPDVVGREVQDFITRYPQSFHLYPAIEQYGLLIFAFGRPELAAREFEKLKTVQWPEYRLKGHFLFGRMMAETGDLDAAKASFDAIVNDSTNDDLAQTYKLLATCENARLVGIQGDTASALKVLNGLIRDHDPENHLLFGYLYNALGAVYEKANQPKEAMMAYLHTQLLFASEPEPHAEALFRLARIWPQLDKADRANDSRETLKSRYRNSYWAKNL